MLNYTKQYESVAGISKKKTNTTTWIKSPIFDPNVMHIIYTNILIYDRVQYHIREQTSDMDTNSNVLQIKRDIISELITSIFKFKNGFGSNAKRTPIFIPFLMYANDEFLYI